MRSQSFFIIVLCLDVLGCERNSQPEPATTVQLDSSLSLPSEQAVAEEPTLWPFSPYFKAHEDLLIEPPKIWQPAVGQLKEQGDHFTLYLIESWFKRNPASQSKAKQIDDLVQVIKRRLSQPACTPENLQFLVERAVYADHMCPEIEGLLILWTRSIIRDARSPAIRQELERIKSSYQCQQTKLEPLVEDLLQEVGMERQVFYESMNKGVRREAELLLSEQDEDSNLQQFQTQIR